MYEIIWRRIRMLLPDDWEMLGYSTGTARGWCWFADRRRERLELTWQSVKGVPDLARMNREYAAKMTDELEFENVRQQRIHQWRGAIGDKGEKAISRFVRHLSNENIIVELVFHWPESRERELEEATLTSVRESPMIETAGAKLQRWRSFGMDICASGDYLLQNVAVQPAHAKMAFGPVKPAHSIFTEEYTRMGMTAHWLRGGVDEWLALKTPVYVARARQQRTLKAGHAIEQISGNVQKTTFVPLKREKGVYHAAAWICPHDHRLYCGSRIAPENDKEPTDIAGRRLVCCADLEARR